MVRDARSGSCNGVEGIVVWMGVEKLRLDGHRNTSFGQVLKYFVWTGVKILHLDGHRNTSFGLGFEKLHLDGRQNLTFGPESKIWTLEFFLDRCQKILLGSPDKC